MAGSGAYAPSFTRVSQISIYACVVSAFLRIFVRKWSTDQHPTPPTYDDAEDFMRFLDKYVSHAVGNHHFMQWSKSNRTKTFLDKVTASDIAYTILVYENSNEVWKEELQIRVTSTTNDDRRKATREKKTGIMKEGGSV